jgi:peptidoglycan/xylan/chitin deacetylase (PgdA/CDA1 family)
VRRVLALLKEYDIRSTFFIPGHTAVAFPKSVVDIAAAGHEIGHHGWVHENPAATTPEQERWILEKGLEALKSVAGVRPEGYRSPSWDNSAHTVELLLEHGFKYESSLMGSEYEPYWCRIGDRWSQTEPWAFGEPVDLVELPVSWLLDDFPHLEYVSALGRVYPAAKTPRQLLEIWIDAFDYLYESIGHGIFNVTMHPEVIGRGARMLVLKGLIEHIVGKKGVTFGTCAEYAAAWRVGKVPSLPEEAASGGH